MKRPVDRWLPFWRRRLLVPFLAVLGLDAATLATFTLPRLFRERTVAARVSGLREEVADQRRVTEALRQRAETIQANQRDSDRFFAEVVGARADRLVPLLTEVEQSARRHGLTAGRWTYTPRAVRDYPLVRFAIELPLEGTYDELVSFLDGIERSKLFVIVDKVELRERRGEGRAELSVTLATYFKDDAGEGGARGR